MVNVEQVNKLCHPVACAPPSKVWWRTGVRSCAAPDRGHSVRFVHEIHARGKTRIWERLVHPLIDRGSRDGRPPLAYQSSVKASRHRAQPVRQASSMGMRSPSGVHPNSRTAEWVLEDHRSEGLAAMLIDDHAATDGRPSTYTGAPADASAAPRPARNLAYSFFPTGTAPTVPRSFRWMR